MVSQNWLVLNDCLALEIALMGEAGPNKREKTLLDLKTKINEIFFFCCLLTLKYITEMMKFSQQSIKSREQKTIF